MAQRYDIGFDAATGPVWSGTAIAITFAMTTPTNISGWNVLVSFKRTASDNAFIKQYSTALANVTVVDAVNGVWSISMSRTDTLLFTGTPGVYVYSFERTDGGSETVLSYGQFKVDRKVNS